MDNQKGLNKRQLEAVNHPDGPILIAAGAGSGKTKTLTSRLAQLIAAGAPPANIVAITFTNKAANEMKERISVSQLNSYADTTVHQSKDSSTHQLINSSTASFVGTFHSFGARILKKEAKLLGRTPAFTIFDTDDSLSLLRKVMKMQNIDREQYSPLKVSYKIGTVKNELYDPIEYLDDIQSRIFDNYEAALAQNNAFDFDDLIEKVVRLFEKEPAVLAKYQNQFRYILVDEYQDVNTSQYRLIKLLADKHRNLSVVGDDAQSIYRFRGSDFRNFLNFENDWPGAKVVKLEQNYRSTGNIITAASALIKNNKLQKPKDLWTENPAGELIRVARTSSAEEEAEHVVDQLNSYADTTVRQSKDSSTHQLINSSTAILYRTNAQSRSIEQSLIAADIPYRIFGGLKFYERKEIKDVVAALRLAANPRDSVSAERLTKTFRKDVGANLITKLPELGKELNILELINFFIQRSDYFGYLAKTYPNAPERIENINELIAFAGEFNNLSDFLERVSLLQSADAPAGSLTPKSHTLNPINLMTIHLAKGLEFDNVFVIGCSEGLLPHQMSYRSLEEIEEERRLMYVAMTRARKNLSLSFYNTASRFLYELPPELIEFTDLAGRASSLPNDDDRYIEDF